MRIELVDEQGAVVFARDREPSTERLCADESSAYNGRRIVGKDWDPEVAPEVAVAKAMQPQGVNVGVNLGKPAGGSVSEHLHVHVVPADAAARPEDDAGGGKRPRAPATPTVREALCSATEAGETAAAARQAIAAVMPDEASPCGERSAPERPDPEKPRVYMQ